jgi:hypothetical protein
LLKWIYEKYGLFSVLKILLIWYWVGKKIEYSRRQYNLENYI